MAHDVLIAIHAVAGVVCFVAGVLSLGLTATVRDWRFWSYGVSLAVMLLLLAAAIVTDWSELDGLARTIYTGLMVLGLYMAYRGVQAARRLHRHEPGWRPRYLDDIGFNLIALFDGFVIILAIDLGVPTWLVVLIAVAGVLVGNLAVRRVKTRLTHEPA